MIRLKDGRLDYKVINKNTYELDENNELRIENDMTIGDYTVQVYGGASFATQQVMQVNFLTNYTRLNPQALLPLTADEILKCAPFPFSNELITRVRSTIVPPQIISEEEGKPMPPPPPPSPQERLMEAKIFAEIEKMRMSQEKMKHDMVELVVNSVLKMKSIEGENIASAASIEVAQLQAHSEDARSAEQELQKMISDEEDRIDESLKMMEMHK